MNQSVTHTPELKACPFCGGKAYLSSSPAEPQYVGKAACKGCGAQIFAADMGAAFTAWNTRSPSTELVEDLVEALKHYADLFCEFGQSNEGCGRFVTDVCAGCKARALVARATGAAA